MENNTDIANDPSEIDAKIASFLTLSAPKSFFLFAGAGSGKTRSLVTALKEIRQKSGDSLRFSGKRVGVITYTNAACDEITKRVDFDPLFEIKTIHSFVWTLIKGFNTDIKKWVEANLNAEIAELRVAESKGRGGKASAERKASIQSKLERLQSLERVKAFNYNPNGENSGFDSLNHSEVIKISSDFLQTKTLMQNILIGRFPVLFIDESQDTNKHLMESFLHVEKTHKGNFLLGLFGDMMQRIYNDGKIDLGRNLPDHWQKPSKTINYRSPRRVVDLINKIRSTVDSQIQESSTKEEGFVHLFIVPQSVNDKDSIEAQIQDKMAAITEDPLWKGTTADVKKLILEHHMAAKRFGFLEMFEPLYQIQKFRTGLLDGTLSITKFFSTLILPILKAKDKNDSFGVASVVRKFSPLVNTETLKSMGDKQGENILKANEAVKKLYAIWKDKDPSFLDILLKVNESGLFEIPDRLKPLLSKIEVSNEPAESNVDQETDESSEEINAIMKAINIFANTSFNQVANYSLYISQKSSFDTHQGIKGKEFPRVMVIIDDSEAKGFLFKYDKLFEVDPKTKADIENEKAGDDTSIERAKRLFYVTCSRAEKSLAIVAYTKDPDQIRSFVVREKWFSLDETTILAKV